MVARRRNVLPIQVLTNNSAVYLDRDPPIELVRELMREYGANLGHDLSFQNFEAELAALPGSYAEPKGCLLVAYVGGEPAGCGAYRSLGDDYCEMKRLYVRPAFRGQAIGRTIAPALMSQARAVGYRAMRLDTLSVMHSAVSLYRSLGFEPIDPYYNNPIPGVTYFEAKLLDEG